MIRRLLFLPLEIIGVVAEALIPRDPLGLGDSFGETVDAHPVFSSNDELDHEIAAQIPSRIERGRGDCTTSGVGWPE